MKNLNDEKVREETISKLKFVIHDIWKEQNLVDASVPSYLNINVKTKNAKELAEMIREKINPNLEFINKPLPLDDPVQRQPVIDLAINKLGWEPKIQLFYWEKG